MKRQYFTARVRTAYLFIMPAIIVYLTIILYPLIYSLYMSLCKYNLNKPYKGITFVGLGNYIAFVTDANFLQSVKVTLQFTFEAVLIELVLGFLFALLLNTEFKGRRFVRTCVLIPLMISQVAASACFTTLLNDQFGFIINLLKQIGITPPAFLSDTNVIMHVMVLLDVWQVTPFVILVSLAGLQSLPADIYESARVDGAKGWNSFWHITFPLMRPILDIIIIIRLMDAFRVFDRIWMLSKGGPGTASMVLTIYSYRQTFDYFNVGSGTASSWIIFLIVALISVVYAKISSMTRYDL